jgi:hypothetical protein
MKDIMRANPDGSPVIIGVLHALVPAGMVFGGLREPPIRQSFENSRMTTRIGQLCDRHS